MPFSTETGHLDNVVDQIIQNELESFVFQKLYNQVGTLDGWPIFWFRTG